MKTPDLPRSPWPISLRGRDLGCLVVLVRGITGGVVYVAKEKRKGLT